MLNHVQVLAGQIGPRGTGTPGEAAAADTVAGILASLHLPVERHTFRAVSSQNAYPMAVDLVALVAIALYPLDGLLTRWLAAAVALLSALLLWQTIVNSENLLRRFLPKVTSNNVITRIEPQGEVGRRVVVLAHLDTNRCRMVWQTGAVRSLTPLTYMYLEVLGFLGVLYLTGALLPGAAWVWWVSLLPAAYIIGTVVTLWRDDQTPFSPGANDNAASVAVALELARRLASRPLASTQVWLAFTGAEETDHGGLLELLRRHNRLMRQAAFIGLEGVGGGDLVYLTRQGLVFPYRPDPDLLASAERVATRHPQWAVRPAEMIIEDEVRTLRYGGYRALCIAGMDPRTGTLAHWHRADDMPETVSLAALENAARFVQALLEEMDSPAAASEQRQG